MALSLTAEIGGDYEADQVCYQLRWPMAAVGQAVVCRLASGAVGMELAYSLTASGSRQSGRPTLVATLFQRVGVAGSLFLLGGGSIPVCRVAGVGRFRAWPSALFEERHTAKTFASSRPALAGLERP